jgi:hypothetical protein
MGSLRRLPGADVGLPPERTVFGFGKELFWSTAGDLGWTVGRSIDSVVHVGWPRHGIGIKRILAFIASLQCWRDWHRT